MHHTAHFDTRAVHAGQEADPQTGAVVAPIYAVSTYKQDGVGGLRNGYEYSRAGNPTRAALEAALASLENGAEGVAFSSGLSAVDAAIRATCRVHPPISLHDLPAPRRAAADGPAVVAEDDCTIWVPGGWEATPGELGALVLDALSKIAQVRSAPFATSVRR